MVEDGSGGHLTRFANRLLSSGPRVRSDNNGDKAEPELKITR